MSHIRSVRGLSSTLLCAMTLGALSGCATARPAPLATRLVAPAQWPAVVDCVMLAARANELWAEADSNGISVTPGLTPLAQLRVASRTSVVGTMRVTSLPTAEGLHVTAQATNWDPPAVGRTNTSVPSATRAMARQLDAQCLADYPTVTTD